MTRLTTAIKDRAERLSARLPQIDERQRVLIGRGVSIAFMAIILYVLIDRLRGFDLAQVWRELPVAPLFYGLFLTRFLLLPVIECYSFSVIWQRSLIRHFGVFVYKNALNKQLFGHSGDVHFALWAKRRLGIRRRDSIVAIKDMAILSAAASNPIAIIALILFLLFFEPTFLTDMEQHHAGVVVGTLAAGGIITLLTFLFRSYVFALEKRKARRVLAAQAARMILGLALLAFMWQAGLPETRLSDWFAFLIIDLVVSRIPPIPGRQFVFLAVSLEVTDLIGAPEETVAALFLTYTVLSLLADMLAVGLFFATGRRRDTDPPEG